jgi:uncharacterized protein
LKKGFKTASKRPALAQIRVIAKKHFNHAPASHDWEHTLRVCRLCRRIGPKEKADMEVLLTAAYLHDIERPHQDVSHGKTCHAEMGAELAVLILKSLDFSEHRRRNIIHCIRSHRFRGNCSPKTIEAKVLYDADKLDSIGAVGVARAFLFAGELGARLHNPHIRIASAKPYSKNDTGFREYKVKLSKIRNRMQTKTGREMAEDRHHFMDDFFNRLQDEYNGKR